MGDKDFMDFIKNPKSTVGMQNGQTIHFTQRIKSGSVDKDAIIKQGCFASIL
jgi:hypothetical protein